jgi:CubicO group peptidase (beta-lactamase class C family)
MGNVPIHGFCDERFASVRAAFERNFELGVELGATFALAIEGELVIDLWSGFADVARTRPWQRDTLIGVSSSAKIATSLCGLMLLDRGLIDLDVPVASYWPEFAAASKSKIPVRQLFCHASGVAGLDPPCSWKDFADWDRTVTRLAAQAPWWESGTVSGYHVSSFGFLLGELVRRTTGLLPDRFLREEVTDKIAADFHFGLPESLDHRLAEVDPGEPRVLPRESMAYRAMGAFMEDGGPAGDPTWRRSLVNGHGNARSLVKAGSVLANGGSLYGHTLLSEMTVRLAYQEQIYTHDLVFDEPVRLGLGFGLASKEFPLRFPDAFHWGGYGGSLVVMEPVTRACWSYVPNRFQPGMGIDRRGGRLSKAAIAERVGISRWVSAYPAR